MSKNILGLASVLVAVFAFSVQAAVIYTFESIPDGPIGTQDNWFVNDNTFGIFGVVGPGSGIDGTKTLSGRSIISRVNDGNFSYSIDFNSTNWGFSFDFTPSGSTRIGYLGADADSSGNLAGVELANYVLFDGANMQIKTTAGPATVGTSMPAFSSTDWLRAASIFNWVAQTVSVYVVDLTNSTEYTAVAGLQNIDISDWKTALNVPGTLGFGLYQYPSGEVDNFAFGMTVPEPASLTLLAMGGLLALRRKSRKV